MMRDSPHRQSYRTMPTGLRVLLCRKIEEDKVFLCDWSKNRMRLDYKSIQQDKAFCSFPSYMY